MSVKLRSSQHFVQHTSHESVPSRGSVSPMVQLCSDDPLEPKGVTSATCTGKLSLREQAEIWSSARVRHLISGETLVVQNTPADALFLVVSGRFEIRAEGQPVPLAEIGTGEPIGEIAFFSGGRRTATAIARFSRARN
jgi:CRP-like cAMP-binding protein